MFRENKQLKDQLRVLREAELTYRRGPGRDYDASSMGSQYGDSHPPSLHRMQQYIPS
jgi:hypothetical protein